MFFAFKGIRFFFFFFKLSDRKKKKRKSRTEIVADISNHIPVEWKKNYAK